MRTGLLDGRRIGRNGTAQCPSQWEAWRRILARRRRATANYLLPVASSPGPVSRRGRYHMPSSLETFHRPQLSIPRYSRRSPRRHRHQSPHAWRPIWCVADHLSTKSSPSHHAWERHRPPARPPPRASGHHMRVVTGGVRGWAVVGAADLVGPGLTVAAFRSRANSRRDGGGAGSTAPSDLLRRR